MKHLYFLLLFLCFQVPAFSTHIVGGVLTYECLDSGTYKFTMKMYRDCSANNSNGTELDFTASFTIFKGDDPNPFDVVYTNVQPTTNIDQPDNPCIEDLPPSVICVEEGIYEFEYTFADWPSTEPYHVTLQRCCRNPTITNIVNPQDAGLTMTVEITPESQSLCNSSPVFNTFPPIVLCVGEPIVYDHSAFDADGDQIVYELCAPLVGGSPNGGPTCDVQVIPDPDCPPPYAEAAFVNPPYSPLEPMGGDPVVTINPVTGLLTGTPTVQGQFVVTVCISEFRNGVLLSVARRDFQFNVTECDPQVAATVASPDIVLVGDGYFLEKCDGPEVVLENTSLLAGNIDTFFWEFNGPDTTFYFNEWDIDATFPGPGVYDGLLALNPGSECGDSAYVQINIYPEIVPGFSYEYDTCLAGPVSFFDASYIDGDGEVSQIIWDLGDSTMDSLRQNPIHIYTEPGLIPVSLEVWDTNGCMEQLTQTVIYQPIPSLILVRPNDTITCPPTDVIFTNLSTPIDDTYEIRWDFGDGKVSSALSPVHRYLEPGLFDVQLKITSPIGCEYDTTFVGLIEMLDPPVARFDYSPEALSNFTPEVYFTDHSVDAVHWEWFVDGDLFSLQQSPVYVFPDTGLHEITLVVTHPERCQDTTSHIIDVEPKVTFYLPNAFTPNEDSNNEFFQGTGIVRGATDFRMEIWDRWGKKIFETTSFDEAWNGRVNNTGAQVQSGVYVYMATFTGPRGKPFEYKGYATVLR